MAFEAHSLDDDEPDNGRSVGREEPSEPTVGVPWESEPVPVSTALKTQQGMIDDLYQQGVSPDQVEALEQQIDDLASKVGEIERGLDILAAGSDVAATSNCPECTGQLDRTRTQIKCDTCGHVAARLE